MTASSYIYIHNIPATFCNFRRKSKLISVGTRSTIWVSPKWKKTWWKCLDVPVSIYKLFSNTITNACRISCLTIINKVSSSIFANADGQKLTYPAIGLNKRINNHYKTLLLTNNIKMTYDNIVYLLNTNILLYTCHKINLYPFCHNIYKGFLSKI